VGGVVLGFLAKRAVAGLVVVVLVSTAVFFITRVVTDPELAFLPIDATDAQRIAVREYLGLDQGIFAQYIDFMGRLAVGDFGTSYWQPGKPAIDIVLERLPSTLLLNTIAMIIALLIAIPVGVSAALKPGSKRDRTLVTLSLVGLSAPQFWLGFMLILIFGVRLGWFPTSGASGALSVVLPALALALPTAGKVAQMMRSSMLDEVERPYMVTAESKGMTTFHRITRHSLRNALVPVVTQSSFEYARMLAGFTVVVETVFAWPGVGLLTVQAMEQQDLVVLQAIVIVVSTMIIVVNLLTDLLYRVIDPRIEVA
jgi:peptide/nickel transport system permease protein